MEGNVFKYKFIILEILGSGEKEVVFLYTLTAGKCPKSFGLNVAQLAGLPLVIIEKAKSKAEVFSSKTDSQRYFGNVEIITSILLHIF